MAMVRKVHSSEILNGMSDKRNVDLNKYDDGRREYPKLEQPPKLVEKPSDYIAVEDAKRNRTNRFKIIDNNGKCYGCSYSYLISWEYDPPALITLAFSDRVFVFQGKNIGKIDRLLVEEKVKVLQVYNPQKHNLPAKGETVIESLTIQ